MATSIELRQRRAGLIKEARDLYEARKDDDGGLAAEDQAQFDVLMNRADELREQFEKIEKLEAAEHDVDQPLRTPLKPDIEGRGNALAIDFHSRGMKTTDAYDVGWQEQREWQRLAQTATGEYRQGFNRWMRTGQQFRALQADSDTLGGYLVTPMQMVDQLLKAVDDMVYIRQWATVFAVPNADSLGVPTLDNDPADADWTTELATGNEDSAMSFGRRALHPHPLAKRIKISNKLLRKVPSSESLVRDRLAYKFGVTWEKAALTGSGSGQPLGVFTASSEGISTGRDVSTDNTTTAVTFDGLINVKFTLKQQYWPRARWLGHRDLIKMVAKLKDGEGQYLWRESVRVGEPDRILGLPVFMSEFAPNTFTTGQYVGILGDFSNYWIADSMALEMQRLIELYAETNQVGLIGRLESDGMPVLEEAFVRVKLA